MHRLPGKGKQKAEDEPTASTSTVGEAFHGVWHKLHPDQEPNEDVADRYTCITMDALPGPDDYEGERKPRTSEVLPSICRWVDKQAAKASKGATEDLTP